WGTADEAHVRQQFAEAGAPEPRIVRADVRSDEDTDALLAEMRVDCREIRVFVSNATEGAPVHRFEEYSARALLHGIEGTAWPIVEYTRRIGRVFGRYPRYVVGISSVGPSSYTAGYDLVAASKASLETLGRYMAHRLFDEGTRVNILRAGLVFTS